MAVPAQAQVEFTVQQCMQYAVEHNHDVRQAVLELDSYQASRQQSVGSFLPAVEANVGAQYNFGRAIDPETNTYTDVSTFYNGYSLSASIPVFDGFGRIHALNAAKADVLMGKSAVQQQRDQVALAVFQAFVDVLYYKETIRLAEKRVDEQSQLLHTTRVMEEVGQKSLADVAQMEAQKAEADYNLTLQQNQFESALLSLKKTMNFPINEELHVLPMALYAHTCNGELPGQTSLAGGGGQGVDFLPAMQQAYYAQQSALHQWCRARADFFPSLSLGVGLSTTFYKTLHQPETSSFTQQFRNNMGEYVAATVSIPLFNRLRTVTNVRRAKNNYLMAKEAYDKQRDQLLVLTAEAALDTENYLREALQMERKVEADSLAYSLVKRKFEEGLLSPTDLKTSDAALLQSQVTLLQKRLMACLKQHLLDYYTGRVALCNVLK